jgi:hypothetical protein
MIFIKMRRKAVGETLKLIGRRKPAKLLLPSGGPQA